MDISIGHEVDYCEKCRAVHAVVAAYLFNALLANAKRESEAAYHLQQRAVVRYEFAHLVSGCVFL
jgi:hypothetical protein